MVFLWVFFVFFFDAIYGHIRLIDPAPRTTGAGTDGLKSYPCGGPAFGSGPSTTLKPGKQWIKFEETIKHAGAPFRIALSIGDDNDYNEYVLVDQVPHNDDATGGMIHAIEVDIPDIACAECSLQIINIMTDKNSGCCPYPDAIADTPACSSVYHSCANIKIEGTIATADYVHEREYPCGQYAPGTALTWTLDNGVWKAPSFGIGDLPNTCGVKMCSSAEEEPTDDDDEPELPPVSRADKAKAHFILTAMALKRASAGLEAVVEEAFADWGFDANDADELFDKTGAISCVEEACAFAVTFEYDVADGVTVGTEEVCNKVIDFLKSAESKKGIEGEFTCVGAPKRVVTYLSPIAYSEAGMLIDDDTEARFVLTLVTLSGATGGIETTMETAYTAWALDTKDASNVLDDFDTLYSCSGGKCEIPLNLAFSVSNTTGVPLEDDADAQAQICTTYTEYLKTSGATGTLTCEIVKDPETGQYWAQVTYSEGSGGISAGAVIGIIIAVLLGLLVVIVLVALFMSKGGNNHDRV